MIKKPPRIGWIVMLSFLTFQGFSQTEAPVDYSKSFQNVTIKYALTSVADHFRLSLYIAEDSLINKNGNWQLTNTSLDESLDIILENTNLGHFVYRNQALIIADKKLIELDYSSQFYELLESKLNTSQEIEEDAKSNEITIGNIKNINGDQPVVISGTLKDEESGEPIIGATLYIEELKRGASTNTEGNYRLSIPIGSYNLVVTSVGYDETVKQLSVFSNDRLDMLLSKEAITLDEIVIQSRAADQNVNQVVTGVEQLSAQTIKELPTFLGEADVVKSLTFLPGVSTIGEGSGGFNVRGGTVDQNLFLQDEVFIFNSSHALGFFSTFNADLINGVTLYKGTMPAQYGGRLASVMKVEMRDGSFDQFKINGGIGAVSSRLSIEAPIIKGKTSFLLGGRMTYSDWILDWVDLPDVKQSSSSFYDFNGRITHNFSDKAKLVLAGYTSNDKLTFSDDFGFDYTTSSLQAGLTNVFGPKLISEFNAVYSIYESDLLNLNPNDNFTLSTGISYLKLKEVLKYTVDEQLNFEFGASYVDYELSPGTLIPNTTSSLVEEVFLEKEFAQEINGFFNTEWNIGQLIAISAGVRFTYFQNVGPGTVGDYEDNKNPTDGNYLDDVTYGDGEKIADYQTIEPRLSLRLNITPESSIKIGYGRTNQFLHQISNTAAATPIDIWQVSNKHLQPQQADNYSIGYFKNWNSNTWETSVEFYYRDINNLIEYKDFADLLANEYLERELLSGIGRAYGAEVSVRRRIGPVSGWLSYTYSRTERMVNGNSPESTVSGGNWYPSNYDKPHDLSLVMNFEINKRHSFSFNATYSTGRPTSGPIGKYNVGNARNIPIYSDRNALRIPDYQRLDIAYNLSPALRKDKKWKGSWTFSVYNVLGRQNAYSVYYTQTPFGEVTANKFSILGSAFPSITYNFHIN